MKRFTDGRPRLPEGLTGNVRRRLLENRRINEYPGGPVRINNRAGSSRRVCALSDGI